MPVDASLRQLVRGPLQGSTATRRGEVFLTNDNRRAAAMGVLNLISDGVLDGDATSCRANKATAAWLRRVQLDRDDAFACQHRVTAQTAEGVELNLAESYKWFALAFKQGDKEAGKKRDDVSGRLDPQALSAARKAAESWTASPQPDEAINVKAPAGGWDHAAAGPNAAKPKARPTSAAKNG